jgi:predicted nucleic acid-binding protein
MAIVVSDANILIDLLQVELFKNYLKLDWEKHAPPDVIDEIIEDNLYLLNDAVDVKQICVPSFAFDDLQQIQEYFKRYTLLSVADCSCIYLAERLSAILLTGEKRLRRIASENHGLEVHGTLWVIDKLTKEKILTYRNAYNKLTMLMKINTRLPKAECTKRLKHMKSNFEQLPEKTTQPVRKLRFR